MGQCCSTLSQRCCGPCCCGRTPGNAENIVMSPLAATPVGTSANDDDTATRDILAIRSFDMCFDENGRQHHTDLFSVMRPSTDSTGPRQKLVIRRGQAFRMRLILNRPYEPATDLVSFVFTLNDDEKASLGHRTLIGTTLERISASGSVGTPNEWASVAESWSDVQLVVLVKPAVNAPIGEWRVDVDIQRASSVGMRSFKYPSTFYVLFNPWCIDDQVYMSDASQLEEYILGDTTLIWRGSYNRLRPSVWKLGQFEQNVLDCALVLVSQVGKVGAAFRGDPIVVSRALSAAVNSPDDDGCVMGNWSENFAGGTPPTRWLGSTAILQEYYSKRRPVKFGQCWVFAGVLTTIARAIGLPSRIITNYSSAHDTQASLTVDYFVDRDGRLMDEMISDSIWNYHVWNEVWMDRPDLGMAHGGYGGWQAIDSTPQEMSDSVYRCGPAPVLAVKLGEVLRPYDCNFLYAEVNADKVFWRYDGPSQPLKLLRKDTLGIGHAISTKAVGRWEREDVTSTYKFAEKSTDERDTMEKALKQTNSAYSRYYLNEDFNDVFFDFELLDDIKIGETFSVVMRIQNRSSEMTYTVNGTLRVESVLYTGKQRDDVKSQDFRRELHPNSVEIIEMPVTFNEYYKLLLDQAAFNISCIANVKDTDYEYFAQDDFRVRKPDVKITLEGRPTSQQEIVVNVRLTNPMPIALRKCWFRIEGTGLSEPVQLKLSEIAPGQTGTASFKYTPPWAGRGSLAAKFQSKELNDVDGFLAFEVKPRPEDVIIDNEIIGRPGYGDRRFPAPEADRFDARREDNEAFRGNGTNNGVGSPRFVSRRDIEI